MSLLCIRPSNDSPDFDAASPPREPQPKASSTSPRERDESAQAGPSTQSPRTPEAEPVPRFVHRRSPPMVRRHGKEPALPEVVEYLEPEQDRRRSGSPTAVNSRPDGSHAHQTSRTHLADSQLARHARQESRSERPVPQPPRPVETPHRPPDIPPPSNVYHTTPPRQEHQSYAPPHAPLQSEIRQQTQTAPLPPAPEQSRHAAPPPPAAADTALTNKRGFIVSQRRILESAP